MSVAGGTAEWAVERTPEQDVEAARAILLRQLARGPRTRAQLAQALGRRSIPEPAARDVLDRFAAAGFIDDRAYAQALVLNEAASGGLARRRVRYRLREKGVPDDVVQECIDAIAPDDEETSAVEFAQRRVSRMTELDPQTRYRRMAGQLARRGYDADTVRKVLAQVLRE